MKTSEAAAVETKPTEAPAKEAMVEIPLSAFVKPEKPKKAAGAYWIYSNAVRETVATEMKEKNDGKAKFGDVAKEVSARWNAMSADEKKPYEEKAASDKARYQTEMVAYNAACDPAAALRGKYADLIPKRPASVYWLFFQDTKQKEKATAALQAEDKEASSTAVTKKLQEMWKEITPEEKNGYQQEQTKEHLEFLEKQKIWQATEAFVEIEQAEKLQTERRKAVDAAVAQKEGEEKAKADRENRMARKQASKTVQTPEKSKGTTSSPTPKAKRARTSKVASPQVPTVEIDAKVLEEAVKAGLDASLKNLAARPEIISSGKTSRAILDALKAVGGLVNPAKRSLLGQ